MRSFLEENLNKPCYILLKEKSSIVYENQKQFLIHPLFGIDKYSNVNSTKKWKWFEQALKVYYLIDKEITFYPKLNDTLFFFTKWNIYSTFHIFI